MGLEEELVKEKKIKLSNEQ